MILNTLGNLKPGILIGVLHNYLRKNFFSSGWYLDHGDPPLTFPRRGSNMMLTFDFLSTVDGLFWGDHRVMRFHLSRRSWLAHNMYIIRWHMVLCPPSVIHARRPRTVPRYWHPSWYFDTYFHTVDRARHNDNDRLQLLKCVRGCFLHHFRGNSKYLLLVIGYWSQKEPFSLCVAYVGTVVLFRHNRYPHTGRTICI